MAKTKDTYAIVSQTILNALEQGVVPWRRPWKREDSLPRSLATKKVYRGGNLMLLMAVSFLREYSSPWWGTYKQFKNMDALVRKGEKGIPVSYFKFIEKQDEDDPEADPYYVPLHRYYTVFNAEQVDGLAPDALPKIDKRGTLGDQFEPIELAETVATNYVINTGVGFTHGGAKAAYSPNLDKVQMPPQETFFSVSGYYSTLFHEFGHSTGHESRLDRKEGMDSLFGNHEYSKEELVAEIGQAIVLAELGLEYDVENTASYIASWSKALQDNPRWFASAGGKAQKAADYILQYTVETE